MLSKKTILSIRHINEKNKNNKSLDDLILALCYSTNQKFLIDNPALLHKAFQEIKLEEKIALLENLVFDNNGVNPWSEKLDDSFCRLETADLLPYVIHGNDSWYVLERSRKYQGQVFRRFNDVEQGQIKRSAKILEKLPQPNFH